MTTDERNMISSQGDDIPADEARISEVLQQLPRVDAPHNFEFHVRARIAKGSPAATAPSGVFTKFRFFAPLSFAVMLAVFAGWFFLRPGNAPAGAEQPGTVASSAPATQTEQAPAPPIESPRPEFAANDPQKMPRREALPVRSASEEQPRTPRAREAMNGGSVDRALSPSKSILPKGISIEPAPAAQKPDTVGSSAKIGVRDVLSQLGIEAEQTAEGWRVKAAAAQSAAGRSGVQIGDLIDAVDDRKLGTSPEFSGDVSFKVLKVIRAGKSLVIQLQNR